MKSYKGYSLANLNSISLVNNNKNLACLLFDQKLQVKYINPYGQKLRLYLDLNISETSQLKEQ